MQLILNVLSLSFLAPLKAAKKKKEREMKGFFFFFKKGASLFKIPWKSPHLLGEAGTATGEGATTATHLSVHTSVIRSTNEWPEHRPLTRGGLGPSCPP